MNLRVLRRDTEAFFRAIYKETYRHGAGLKADMDTAQIHSKYGHLFSTEVLGDLAARRREVSGDEAQRLRLLQGALTAEFLHDAVKELTDRWATEQAKREVRVDGETIPFRLAAVRQQNESDRDRRSRLFDARVEVVRDLNAISKARWSRLHALSRSLGYSDYAHLFSEIKGIDFGRL